MRTRFAPSPTGSLHVGGLRTALFGWLIAKQTQGKFFLRIEDTDQAREVEGTVDVILKGLEWAGIPPDEGVVMQNGVVTEKGTHGPYFQSKRLHIYREYAEKLIADGHAYHCFCTAERLDAMRTRQQEKKQAPMYDRHCVHLDAAETAKRIASSEKYVIRLKMPHDRTITFDDDIRGRVSFEGKNIDDQVLLKSDGFPTYHLAHVVDDHFMETDMVIRGEEWLPSLPKHLVLFEMLGWAPPRYAHVPLLLNKDKSKLSKRQNSVSVEEYINKGYLPEAMINFLAMLGWNSGTTQDIFSMQELIEQFSIERVQKSGAIFDLEKLDWLQGQWMRTFSPEEFAKRILPLVESAHPAAAHDDQFTKKAALIQERITFFHEAPDMLGFFYSAPHASKELMASKKQKIEEANLPKLLSTLEEILTAIPENEWTAARMLSDVKAALEPHNLKLGQLLWPLRALLTGREYSPGAVEVAEVLGKEETLRRLRNASLSM